MLLSESQVPGPTPLWVKYGPPQITTFSNASTACAACVEFYPKKEDGKRFHDDLYQDKNGGVWPRSCRAGSCDFRDPQTDPVGGVVGKGVGPGGKPDGKTCLTRDPVPWFADCELILFAEAKSVLDVTRYCSYREQMFIPPPTGQVSHFGGKPEAWKRIGGNGENCLATISKQGANLFDSTSNCDVDLKALSGCCETVYSALTCVAESSAERGLSPGKGGQASIFASMTEEGEQMLEAFSSFCVPLCENTKEEFCGKFPASDPCITYEDCQACTGHGGAWCPQLKSCHCPTEELPCVATPVTAPLQCLPKKKKKLRKGGANQEIREEAQAAEKVIEEGPPGEEKALCKYAEMAREWK